MTSSRTTGSACATATKPNAAIIVMIERFIIWQMLFCTLFLTPLLLGCKQEISNLLLTLRNPLPTHWQRIETFTLQGQINDAQE
jgi:hypothetical protein